MENLEPDGYEIVYEYGADLNNIPNDNPDELYQDMLKPLDFQKPDPIISLSKEEYEEKMKRFIAEITIKEDINESSSESATSDSNRCDLDNDMLNLRLGDDTKNTGE
jgi:hypothetical protein